VDALEGLELFIDLLTLEVKNVCEGHEVKHVKVQ
jgi:hypothetical protein